MDLEELDSKIIVSLVLDFQDNTSLQVDLFNSPDRVDTGADEIDEAEDGSSKAEHSSEAADDRDDSFGWHGLECSAPGR